MLHIELKFKGVILKIKDLRSRRLSNNHWIWSRDENRSINITADRSAHALGHKATDFRLPLSFTESNHCWQIIGNECKHDNTSKLLEFDPLI